MTNFLKNTLAALLVLGTVVSAHSIAFAQASAPSSVLPTGGGAALLDPSDTVILLLDHQAGLFQTVKDISVSDLRANVTVLAKLATLLKDSGHHDSFRAQWAEWADHAGNQTIRAAFRLRGAKGRSECMGQRRLRQDSARNGTKDTDHGRCLDERLRDVSGARRQGGGVQGLCSDGCLRRSERNGIAHDARSLRASWCHSHLHERGFVRGSSYVEPTRSVRTRKALCPRGAELRRFD